MPDRGVTDLQEELSRLSGRRVLLHLTDNRSRMVSARRGDGFVEARLQRIFLGAPDAVVREVADLLAGRGSPKTAIRRFIAANLPGAATATSRRQPRPSSSRLASAHHDIARYASDLNAAYLGGRSKAGVVWGRRNKTRSRSSIRFGCYDPARNIIIMNRKLDSPDIPGYFVEFILFHEMLHEVLGMDEGPDGRRRIHGKLFKLMESTYPDYDKALRFEKELCKRLSSL